MPRLLQTFERECLARHTPCRLDDAAAIAGIAETRVEFILIHPFREGNGSLSRLLADVMAMQAGHAPLDYSSWDEVKPGYIAAIHAGHAGDYVPMRLSGARLAGSGEVIRVERAFRLHTHEPAPSQFLRRPAATRVAI